MAGLFEYKIREVHITQRDVDLMNVRGGRPLKRSMDTSSVKEDGTGKGYKIEQRYIVGLSHLGKDVVTGLGGLGLGFIGYYSGAATAVWTAVQTLLH